MTAEEELAMSDEERGKYAFRRGMGVVLNRAGFVSSGPDSTSFEYNSRYIHCAVSLAPGKEYVRLLCNLDIIMDDFNIDDGSAEDRIKCGDFTNVMGEDFYKITPNDIILTVLKYRDAADKIAESFRYIGNVGMELDRIAKINKKQRTR